MTCRGCGGSGLRADELERMDGPLTTYERECLDSTACRSCYGRGVESDDAFSMWWGDAPAKAADGAP